jgi:SAM-dependent methyltransferase
MKKIIKKIIRFTFFPFVASDFLRFSKVKNDRFSLSLKDVYPCVKDKTVKTGFDRHYVYHTSWAARKVAEIKPVFHTDISSSLFFSGIVSAFVPVKFYDYRPAELSLSGLESKEGNLMNLPFADASVSSLSCMHTVEHIGLGRYGDPIDSEGDLKAIAELKRVVAKDGSLLFVVPMGKKAKIEFNAHRIYTYDQVMEYFEGLQLKEFAMIPEKSGDMVYGVHAVSALQKEDYACGCFWFVKK